MKIHVNGKLAVFGMILCLLNYACIQNREPKGLKQKVELITDFGTIVIQLSDETPIHRDNFIKLTKEGFFDGVLWHRVIDSFLIQTGDPTSKDALGTTEIGAKDVGYDLTAEIQPHLFHKRGAINAARESDDVTPERKSSGSQFTIIQGRVYTDEELDIAQQRINEMMAYNKALYLPRNAEYLQFLKSSILNSLHQDSVELIRKKIRRDAENILDTMCLYTYPDHHRQVYKTIGGAAHLDQNYTVFGEVIKGMHVVDRITMVKTKVNSSRPVKDVRVVKANVLQ